MSALLLPDLIGFVSPIAFGAYYRSPYEVTLAVKQVLAINALLHAAMLSLLPFGTWRLYDAIARVGERALRGAGLLTFFASAALTVLTWAHAVRRFLQGTTPAPFPPLELGITLADALHTLSLCALLYLFARAQLSARVRGWTLAAGISVLVAVVVELVPIDAPPPVWLAASLLSGIAEGLCVFVALAQTLKALRPGSPAHARYT